MADEGSGGGFALPAGRQTLHEHEECLAAVGKIEACLDRPPSEPAAWLADLREQLAGLKAILEPHFREETEGYLYTEVPARLPGHTARLEQLKSEHGEILRDIGEVIARASREGAVELHDLREVNARAQLLVARIRRHEAEENEIIMSSIWDDIGAAD